MWDSTLCGICTKPGIFALATKNFALKLYKHSSLLFQPILVLRFNYSFWVWKRLWKDILHFFLTIFRECGYAYNTIMCFYEVYYATNVFTQLQALSISWHLFQLLCSFNAKNFQKYGFGGIRGANVSRFREVAPNCYGCSPTAFTIFADSFIMFNLNPDWLVKKLLYPVCTIYFT